MGESIKELVERLDEHWGRRRLGDMSSLFADAADALEALTEERNRLKAELEWVRAMATLTLDGAEALDIMEVLCAERERLRNEKVAGGPTGLEHEAQVGSVSSPAPATDPAPVCEWSNASGRMVSTCMPNGVTIWLWNERNQEKCINCLNKIKFTEAK